MNFSERRELLNYREKLAHRYISSRKDELAIQKLLDSTLYNIELNPKGFLAHHFRVCQQTLKDSGVHPSALYLTTWGILDTEADGFFRRAYYQALLGKTNPFILYFDTGFSIRHVSLLMQNAELSISKGPDFAAMQLVGTNRERNRNRSLPEHVENYLALEKLFHTSTDFLKQDPSGFLLIDQTTSAMQGEANAFGPLLKPKNVANIDGTMQRNFPRGITFAKNAYKASYPIAREIVLES